MTAGSLILLSLAVHRSGADRTEETPDVQTWARMTLDAECECNEGPLDHLPVVPPEQMLDWQSLWTDRPELRALIRAAARLGEQRCNRSAAARALWEMSQSEAFMALGMPA